MQTKELRVYYKRESPALSQTMNTADEKNKMLLFKEKNEKK